MEIGSQAWTGNFWDLPPDLRIGAFLFQPEINVRFPQVESDSSWDAKLVPRQGIVGIGPQINDVQRAISVLNQDSHTQANLGPSATKETAIFERICMGLLIDELRYLDVS